MANILVAGAGKGIGKATAEYAHKKGHNVFAVSRNKLDLRRRPYKTFDINLGASKSTPFSKEFAYTIDAVINCTGIHPGTQEFNNTWQADVKFTINQNLDPALELYHTFLPVFRERKKGHFVHISSAALDFFDASESGYCASKAALEAVVKSLQNGEQETGILHHAVRVSLTDTPLARRVYPTIKDWNPFYTAKEIASYLVDVVENPANYPKTIVKLPYKPVRIN
ncbi:MAG: SDR family oxidoreductase [Candidatus Woesearchaeota archaeon]|nr:MAG: SDR family oxidoreductase [Candidatus Woesearchaeota archaeon]